MNFVFTKSPWVMAMLTSLAITSNAATTSIAPGQTAVFTDPAGSGRSAPLSFLSGTGAYDFSNGTGVPGGIPTTAVGGLVGAINVGQVALTGVDGAVLTEEFVTIGRAKPRALVRIGATVTSLTANDQTGEILSVSSVGGASEQAPYTDGVLNGGTVVTKNLRFDLQSKIVYADMIGTPLVFNPATGLDEPGQTFTQEGIALWTIGSISGPTTLPPAALIAAVSGNTAPLSALGFTIDASGPDHFQASAVDVLTNLKVTEAGFKFFAKALGLEAGSTGYSALAGVNDQPDGWGSVVSKITFSSSVPEPATYALMGLGLVGIAALRRRR